MSIMYPNHEEEMHSVETLLSNACFDLQTTLNEYQEKVENKISKAALEVLTSVENTLFHTVLTIGKIAVLTLEIACIALLTVVKAIFTLFYPQEKATALPALFISAVLDDLKEAMWITIEWGIVPSNERSKPVDNQPNSPRYILIEPKQRQIVASPILYAPGYLDQAETLRSTCRRLANRTGNPVYIINYKALLQSITEHAKDIERLATKIIGEHKYDNFILIGHSMGGVATERYISTRSNQAAEIKLWTTIGSPLSGTPVAYLGIGACAAEMRPNSQLLQEVKASPISSKVPQLHIQTRTDLVVPFTTPPETSKANVWHYVCKNPYGHLSVRSNKEVEDLIVSAIIS